MSNAKPKAKRHNADVAASKERQLAPLREHAYLPGQSGNPAGRPKGSRNKLTTEFFDDFHAAWQAHGAQALKEVAEKSPRDFVRAAAMLMPKEFEIKSPLNELTDADLADLITAVQSLIAGGVALPAAGGDRPATKPH
jgi:hypothetical protein